MLDKIQKLKKTITQFDIKTKEELESFRLNFLARKGKMNDLGAEVQASIKTAEVETKKALGKAFNELKQFAQHKFKTSQSEIQQTRKEENQENTFDLTLPVVPNALGSVHPLRKVQNRMIEIFERIGFNISSGPEIEQDWYNFTALNFPPNHPAREMQDTFFIEKNPDMVLRTHTSSVQIRTMEEQKPPIRTLSPGRVFRNEAISARAHCVFHQVEGLYIDENVSLKNLKETLYYFAREMFGQDTKIRFRPSFFPFTEPSAEVDISCHICKGKGCNVCKYTGWVEIGGCGMVDPNVLRNCGIDPEIYSGFAFGMGIDRIALLQYQISDIRLLSENDVRFLEQFKSAL